MKIHRFLIENSYSLVNGFKCTIAALFGFLIGYFLSSWFEEPVMTACIIITILVVMSNQPNQGGLLEKSILRITGTLLATILGALVLVLFENFFLRVLLGLFLVFLSSFLAATSMFSKYSYGYVLGSATIGLVLLVPNPSIKLALLRGCEVSIGIFIAIAVNRYILPIKSHSRLCTAYCSTLKIFKYLHRSYLHRLPDNIISEQVFNSFITQTLLLKESRYECSKTTLFIFREINISLKKLYCYISVTSEYIYFYPEEYEKFSTNRDFLLLHSYIEKLLGDLCTNFQKKRIELYLLTNIQETYELVEKLKKTLNRDMGYIGVVVFSINTTLSLIKNIYIHQEKIFTSSL